MHIFSGTKSFSCALALLLEADGALDLNEDVQDTLPELAAGAGVTPDTLLHFTSGVAQDNRALTRDRLLGGTKHRGQIRLPRGLSPSERSAPGGVRLLDRRTRRRSAP
ncbi:MAG: serine hydrolase [Deltaproteobacteria bacterium]|nr:serine hydrolase [Deltaproteobacteria bacterium]